MILKKPQRILDDFFDQARFELTWRINAFMSIALFVLLFVYLFLDDLSIIPCLVGWLITVIMLIVLRKPERFLMVAKVWTVIGLIICVTSVFAIEEALHIIDPIWMLIISFYAYFVLGKIWGNVTIVVGFSGYAVFFMLGLNANLRAVGNMEFCELIALTLNLLICGLVLAYLMSQFLNTKQHVFAQYEKANIELKQQNLLVLQQHQEKTIMLKEIHHRVKNNLQVIISLLRLQSHELKTEEAKDTFSDAVNRIVAMSLIHEKMYQTKDLGTIDTASYLEGLALDIIASFKPEASYNIIIKSDYHQIGSKTIVPLALIFNELVTNSVKHAFKGAVEGEIVVHLSALEANYFIFSYRDSGIWINQEQDKSFGVELIHTMAEQLDGNVTREIGELGTVYYFKLKNIDEIL